MKYNQITVSTMQTILRQERAFQLAHQDTNTNKKLVAVAILSQMLENLDEQATFSNLESVKNSGKNVRDFEMFNIGSAVELVVKAVASGKVSVKKSMGKGVDLKYDGKMYDVKACLSSTCKNTPMARKGKVMLVNQLGVWLLSVDEAMARADKFGRYEPKGEYTEYAVELSEALGF